MYLVIFQTKRTIEKSHIFKKTKLTNVVKQHRHLMTKLV